MIKGLTAGLASGALWGLVFVAPPIISEFSDIDITAGRFIIFGATSIVIMLLSFKKMRWPNFKEMLVIFILSILGFTGYYWFLVTGIRYAGSPIAALIVGTLPLWIMILGKPENLSWKKLAPSLLLTAIGIILMGAIHADYSNNSGNDKFTTGILFSVAACISWTFFSLGNSKFLLENKGINAIQWTCWLGISTGISGLLMFIFWGTPLSELQSHTNWNKLIIVLLILGIGASWLGMILWNIASQRLQQGLCGQLIVSETIFALIYAFLWAGKIPSIMEMSAAILCTFGILLGMRAYK